MRHWHLGTLIVALATCTLLLATLYRGSTRAHAFSPPTNGFYVAIDCDTTAAGIQDDCPMAPSDTTRDVAVAFGNVDVPNSEVKSFQFTVRANQSSFNPRAGADANLNGNPDFNDSAFQPSGWNCGIIPPERDRNPDPAVAESTLYCFRGPGGMPISAGTTLTLAAVHYDAIGGRTSDFDLLGIVVGDDTDGELLSCNPSSDAPGPCYSARIGPPRTPTSTPPPGSTDTPTPSVTPTSSATPTDVPTITPTSTNTPTVTPTPISDGDGDGMSDLYELSHPCLNFAVADGQLDHDNDGLSSLRESEILTDACSRDSELDGMLDGYEDQNECLDPLFPDASDDFDGDGIINNEERIRDTLPCNADTEGDGYNDGLELQIGENPASYCGIMRADVNNSRNVDVIDLYLAAREAGPVPPHNPRMNQTNDGKIDVIDLFRIAQSANKNVSTCP